MAGAPGRRAGCTRANTYDGEVIGPSTSMAAPMPLANTVFPAPSGPESTTTSPARSCRASRDPSAIVSSTRSHVAVPSRSATAPPQLFTHSPQPQGRPGRGGPPDQADQSGVDGVGLVQQRQVAGAGDDDQFGLRQAGGHLSRVLVGGQEVVVAARDQG